MKILHTSDWHLGQYFYGKSRADEHLQLINWLVVLVEEQQIDAVIIAGDVFDTGTPPSYARELYFSLVAQLNQLGCQLVVLAGNHDSVAMLSESKQVLSHLNTHVIACANKSDTEEQQLIELTNKQGQHMATLCAIPFIRPKDVVKSLAGQSLQEKQQQLQQGISNHYHHLYEKAQQLGKPVIMTGHLTTVGATTSDSVREIYIGNLEAFPASQFPPADYIALGHIHRPQLVAKNERIRYCGSPIALSFDETGQEKQVVIIEADESSITNITPQAIPCFQPMATLKTTIDKLAPSLQELADQHHHDKPLWLDIEIQATGYLDDISARVQEVINDLPIEALMIRRAKASRQKMARNNKQQTLAELTVDDVFNERLAQESWQTEEELTRKTRITDLFKHYAHGEGNQSDGQNVSQNKADKESQ